MHSFIMILITDLSETWSFVNNRVKDAFDLQKTVQEVILRVNYIFIKPLFIVVFMTFSDFLLK